MVGEMSCFVTDAAANPWGENKIKQKYKAQELLKHVGCAVHPVLHEEESNISPVVEEEIKNRRWLFVNLKKFSH